MRALNCKRSYTIGRLVYLAIVFILLGGCKNEVTHEEAHELVLFD